MVGRVLLARRVSTNLKLAFLSDFNGIFCGYRSFVIIMNDEYTI